MESKSKKELREMAEACFTANKNHDEYHQTADGLCFTNWHDANEHSKTIGSRTIVLQKRNEEKESAQELKLQQIADATTIEALMEIKIGNREHPSVREAMEARIAEFNAAEAKKKADAEAEGKTKK